MRQSVDSKLQRDIEFLSGLLARLLFDKSSGVLELHFRGSGYSHFAYDVPTSDSAEYYNITAQHRAVIEKAAFRMELLASTGANGRVFVTVENGEILPQRERLHSNGP